MCKAGQRVSLTIASPGLPFIIVIRYFISLTPRCNSSNHTKLQLQLVRPKKKRHNEFDDRITVVKAISNKAFLSDLENIV